MLGRCKCRLSHWMIIGALLSFICLSLFFTSKLSKYPSRSLGGWGTDHIVHISMSYASWYKGFDLLRYSPERLFQKPPFPLRILGQKYFSWDTINEIFFIKEDPEPILFPFNWILLPRPYPPGVWLYHLPEAICFRVLGIEMQKLAAVVIIKYLMISHIALLILGRMLFKNNQRNIKKCDQSLYWMVVAPIFLVIAYQLIYWSLSGFYEVVAILFLFLSIDAIGNKQNLKAIFWYSIAFFLSFRCLWLISIPMLAFVEIMRRGEWKTYLNKTSYIPMAGILFFGGIALYSLLILFSSIGNWPMNNPMYFINLYHNPQNLKYVFPLIIVICMLFIKKHWILLFSCISILFFLHLTRHSYAYHSLFVIPIFALAAQKRTIMDWSLTAVFYAVVSLFYIPIGPFYPESFNVFLDLF